MFTVEHGTHVAPSERHRRRSVGSIEPVKPYSTTE